MAARESVLKRLGTVVRLGRSTAVPLLFALVTSCGQAGISGEYIAKFSDGVFHLHIVETPDKRITGELDTAILQSNGQIQYQDMAVTGAADGSTLSLSIKPVLFLSATVPLSGTIEQGKLTLAGSVGGNAPGVTVFARSDSDEYQRQLKALDAQSRQILAAKALAAAREKAAQQDQAFVETAGQLVARMQRFDSAAEGDIEGLPAYQTRMKEITAGMDSYLARERQLAGNPNAAVARGQISVAMSQGMIATDELLNQIRSLESQFQAHAEPLMQAVTATSQSCRWAQLPIYNVIKPGPRASACRDVLDAVPTFTRNFENLRGALQAWEADYSSAHDAQQRLVDSSQAIE